MIKRYRNPVSEQNISLCIMTIESRKHISEELFLKLRDAILNGDLPEGYVFPNENELWPAGTYRTRKSTEAYSSWKLPHLITTQDRDLCQQHQRNSKQHEFPCNCQAYRCTKSEGVPSNRRDRHGAVSCKKSDPGHIQRLEELLAAMNAAGDDPTKLSQLDFEFHSSLVRITDNELLFITFNTIRSIYEGYTEQFFAQGYFQQSLVDHRKTGTALHEKTQRKQVQWTGHAPGKCGASHD